MGQQILGSDKILRMNDFNLLGLVQSEDWNPNFNAQDIFEMGVDTKVATAFELETSGSLELGSIGGTPGLLARTIVKRNVSGAFTGYEYNPAGGNGKNAYTFTQASLKEAQFDLLIHEKSDQLTFDRTVVLPRCFITTISGRVDSNGVASETVNWGGDFVIGAPSPYHDVRSLPATIGQGADAGKLILSDPTVVSPAWAISYAYVDEIRLRTVVADGTYVTLDGSGGKVTVTGFTGFATNFAKAVCRVVVYKVTSPATVFPVLTTGNRDTTAFYVRGYQANVFIAPANPVIPTDSEKWLRVQSMDFTIDLRVEPLRQIAFNKQGTSIYCRVPTFPFDLSANISTYESDWKDWKAVLTKTFPGNDVYQDTLDFAPENLKETFAIVVEYRTKTGTLLQTWRFTDMRIDGYGQRAGAGARSEISWPLRGTAFTLVGANA